jgi:hypothetical protein
LAFGTLRQKTGATSLTRETLAEIAPPNWFGRAAIRGGCFKQKIVFFGGNMYLQTILYFIFIVLMIIIDIIVYQGCITSYLNIDKKDGVSILVVIITVTTIVPTYLFTRLKEFNDKKLEIEKNKSMKKYEMKMEQYRTLIPFLFIKNSPANIMSYDKLHSEAITHSIISFGDDKLDIKKLADYSITYSDIKENPRYRIYNYAQSTISQISWAGHILFSDKIIGLIKDFNSISFNENICIHNDNHKQKLFDLLNAMRSELDNENLKEINY